MNSKYYTPEIEEFHVGFEYEVGDLGDDGESRVWRELTFEGEDTRTYFIKELKKKEIRIKYLDREDVESLGFKLRDIVSKNRNIYESLKDSFLRISVIYKSNIPFVSIYHYGGWETPDLIIKNKSELEKLLKQLNIK